MYSLILSVALTTSPGPETPPAAEARGPFEQGLAEMAAGRFDEAEAAFVAALEAEPASAPALSALGTLRHVRGRSSEAEPLLRRAAASSVPGSLSEAEALTGLAGLLLDTGRTAEADRTAERALEIIEAGFGARSARRVPVLIVRSEVRLVRGDLAAADRLLREADRLAAWPVPSSSLRAAVASRRGVLYMVMGRYGEAEPLLELSLDLTEQVYGPDHPALLQLTYTLASCYQLRNRTADAAALYERFLAVGEKTYPAGHPFLRRALVALEETATRLDDRARAASYRLRLAAYPQPR